MPTFMSATMYTFKKLKGTGCPLLVSSNKDERGRRTIYVFSPTGQPCKDRLILTASPCRENRKSKHEHEKKVNLKVNLEVNLKVNLKSKLTFSPFLLLLYWTGFSCIDNSEYKSHIPLQCMTLPALVGYNSTAVRLNWTGAINTMRISLAREFRL